MAQDSVHTTNDGPSWQSAVGHAILPADMDFPSQKQFNGSVRATSLFDVDIISVTSALHMSERTRHHVQSDEHPSVILSMQHKGSFTIKQNNGRVTIRPGEYSLYTSYDPVELVGSDGYESLAIKIPVHNLGLDSDALREVSTRLFSAHDPFSAAIWGLVMSLGNSRTSVRSRANVDVAHHLTGLIKQLLKMENHELDRVPNSAQSLRLQCMQYIDQHLTDPNLTPEVIAENNYISTRYLHHIFEGSGSTVSGYIREQRLRAAQRDLVAPEVRHVPVRTIAHKWGFTNLSHFGRLFKAFTGVPPAEYRRSAD